MDAALAFAVAVVVLRFLAPFLRAALWQCFMRICGVPAKTRREVLAEKARSNGK